MERWKRRGDTCLVYIDVDEEQQDSEMSFLKTSIYIREVELKTQIITAINRHSARV